METYCDNSTVAQILSIFLTLQLINPHCCFDLVLFGFGVLEIVMLEETPVLFLLSQVKDSAVKNVNNISN